MSRFENERSFESLINELKDQKARLATLDLAEEVNVHCDNLIIDVTLTIQSEVDKLNKLESKLLAEIEEYRQERLRAHESESFQSKMAEAKKKIEKMSAKSDEIMAAEDCAKTKEKARRLIFEMSLLESKMKRDASDKHYLRLQETPTIDERQVIQLVQDRPVDKRERKKMSQALGL